MEYNYPLTKVDWLGLRVFGAVLVVLPALAENLHNPQANRKQRQIHKEMSQTLLTNKKQGNLD